MIALVATIEGAGADEAAHFPCCWDVACYHEQRCADIDFLTVGELHLDAHVEFNQVVRKMPQVIIDLLLLWFPWSWNDTSEDNVFLLIAFGS